MRIRHGRAALGLALAMLSGCSSTVRIAAATGRAEGDKVRVSFETDKDILTLAQWKWADVRVKGQEPSGKEAEDRFHHCSVYLLPEHRVAGNVPRYEVVLPLAGTPTPPDAPGNPQVLHAYDLSRPGSYVLRLSVHGGGCFSFSGFGSEPVDVDLRVP